MDSSMIQLRDALLRLTSRSLDNNGNLVNNGDNDTMMKAMSNAYDIADLFKLANGNLSQSWREIASLCEGVSNNCRESLYEVVDVINNFINESIENENIYKPALDKTKSEVERLFKELDLHESLG